MITRDISKVVLALADTVIITASTANQVWVATGLPIERSSCGLASTGGIAGLVIDRLGPNLGARYQCAEPAGFLWSSRGSTEADGKLTLGPIILQHGDSSGGGDMANYSTGTIAPARIINTSAQTTPEHHWSTAALESIPTKPSVMDITAAKRFVRVVLFTGKNASTTESSGYESYHVASAVTFREGDRLPETANTTGPNSTSTSTST